MEAVPPPRTYVQGEFIVQYQNSDRTLVAQSEKYRFPLHVTKELRRTGCFRVELPEPVPIRDAIKRLRRMPGVLHVEPNFRYDLRRTPDDPEFARQWGLQTIGAPDAWDVTTGSSDIVVAVFDTGLQYLHEDIRENAWRNPNEIAGNQIDDDNNGYIDDIHGVDFVEDDADPLDDDGHGSHVSGIIGARGNNAAGVAGVNWDISIMALRITSVDDFATTDKILDALQYVVDMKSRGINIVAVNNSWGGPNSSQILHDAFTALADVGIVIVCAAGNQGQNSDLFPEFPANYDVDGLLSVAASTRGDRLAGFSNFGLHNVDLAAPGTTTLSLHKDNDSLNFLQGTSMAAPHVTGAAALLFASDPTLSPTALASLLVGGVEQSAEFLDIVGSGGRLSLTAPLEVVKGDNIPDLVVGASTASVTVGKDVYLSGGEQTLDGIATFGNPLTYFFHLENDGNDPDAYRIEAQPVVDEAWTVRFYQDWSGGSNITDDVVAGTFETDAMQPGQFIRFRVEIEPVSSSTLTEELMFTVRCDSLNASTFDQAELVARTDRQRSGIRLASYTEGGHSANNRVLTSTISGDGRYAVFTSEAGNMVVGDTNGVKDVFVRDMVMGITRMASVTANGEVGSEESDEPSISADGRYVAFHSASAFQANDTNGASDIYLKDMNTGELTRISEKIGGGNANNSSFDAEISADGSSVVYYSFASDIVNGDINPNWDVFVYDTFSGTTEIVSVSSAGNIGDGASVFPHISEDGRVVVFASEATNLTSHTHSLVNLQVYLHDRDTGNTDLISVSDSGVVGNSSCGPPFVSGDGNVVLYETASTNIIPGETNEFRKVILREWRDATNGLVSYTDSGSQANGDSFLPASDFDGRHITFTSVATNILHLEAPDYPWVYLWDRLSGLRQVIGVNALGAAPRNTVWGGTLSSDGQIMAFNSWANNLTHDDGNGSSDVFSVNLGTVRPNAMIARLGEVDYAGGNELGEQIDQRRSQEILPGNSANYVIRVVNQGLVADRFLVTSTGARPDWEIHYTDAGTNDVTENVVSSGWVSDVLAPGECFDLELEVTAAEDWTVPSTLDVIISVMPDGTPGISDRVRAVTTVLVSRTISRSFPGSVLVSRGFSGEPGNNFTSRFSISGDGRFVAFESDADNLVMADFNVSPDVFRADIESAALSRVSESLAGDGGLSRSTSPSISRDGKRIAFHSRSDNIIESETEFRDHIYLRDYEAGSLLRITVTGDGAEADRGSEFPVLSGNGQYILFETIATNLVTNDTNGVSDLYLYDIDNDLFSVISETDSGVKGNGDSSGGYISADGRFVVFNTFATNLTGSDDNAFEDVVFLDRNENKFEFVSNAFDGGSANGPSFARGVSDDGRFVLFSSYASNIVSIDSNDALDLFLHDREQGITIPINIESQTTTGTTGSGTGAISPDGTEIAFTAIADTLDPAFSPIYSNVVVYTIATKEMNVISVTNLGDQPDGDSFGGRFNADGRYLGFLTNATDLIGERDVDDSQLMIYDRARLQPDLALASSETGNVHGFGEFEANGQKTVQLTTHSETRVFLVLVDNQGTYPDRFVFTSESEYPAARFFFDGTDITDEVRNDGWVSAEVAAHQSFEIEVRVTETVMAPVDRILRLHVRSETDPSKHDTVTLVTETDADGDRIADTWEISHWGATSVATAGSDSDGDDVSDRHEFIAGTDPTDPASNPTLTIEGLHGNAAATLRWQSRDDRFYRLERAQTLADGFEDVSGEMRGNPTEMTYEDIGSDSRSKSFYRLKIERP